MKFIYFKKIIHESINGLRELVDGTFFFHIFNISLQSLNP